MFSDNGGTTQHLSKKQIRMLERNIDKGVADTTVSLEVHTAWVRMRAKLDRMLGDEPLRRLLGGSLESRE